MKGVFQLYLLLLLFLVAGCQQRPQHGLSCLCGCSFQAITVLLLAVSSLLASLYTLVEDDELVVAPFWPLLNFTI